MFRISWALRQQVVPKVTHIPDKLLINGKFVSAISGKTFPVYNPATEEVLANAAMAEPEDVDAAVKAARAAFKEYRLTDGAYRRDLMLRLADILHKNREEMAALESLDNGKPFKMALDADVSISESCFRYYAGFADKIYGQVAPVSGSSLSIVKREPVGVCGQIVPWNFPLMMASWKLAPALVMGNTCVLKPAEQTPLSALRLGEMMIEAGYPAGTVNILSGLGAAGGAISKHMDIDKVAFTGSTMVGRTVMMQAAESNIKKVSLELGGKSALIVCEDADVEKAAKVASTGIYFNMGQVCTASSRILVHEKVHDQFVELLKKHAESRQIGHGQDIENEVGPLVSKNQQQKVLEYVKLGQQEGATLVTGGARAGDKGYFVKPTIFTNVKDDMRINKEEIFGPVVCISKFTSIDDAVNRANDSIYGLAAGICTSSMNTALRYSSFLEAGTVWINSWNVFDVAQPFGGYKQSGIGRELGPEVLNLYSETKTVYFALEGPIVKP